MLTVSEAACVIYNLTATKHNGDIALARLKKSGLEPVYHTHGNPYMAFAIATSKIDSEPWKYQRYSMKEGPALKYSHTYGNHPFIIYHRKRRYQIWNKKKQVIQNSE